MCTTLMRATRVRQKAGREREGRGEREEETGERGEQAQAALRDTHLAGKAAGVIQGCWSRRLEQGCPWLPPCGERHTTASRTFWKVLPCPRHFKPQNIFPVPASLLSPLGASPTAATEGGERGLGCWNYRINFSASGSKHLPGSRRQLGCQDPPAPGATGRGNRAQAARGLLPQALGGLQDSELPGRERLSPAEPSRAWLLPPCSARQEASARS